MGTYGRVRRLVVDVHKGTADVGQDLDLVLQLLAQVVRLPERRVRVHHDVDLDVVVLQPPRVSPTPTRAPGSHSPVHSTTIFHRSVREKGQREGGGRRTWYARTVSICSISSENVVAL